jgi:hypothetical protein
MVSVFWCESLGKRPLGRSKIRKYCNITVGLKMTGCEDVIDNRRWKNIQKNIWTSPTTEQRGVPFTQSLASIILMDFIHFLCDDRKISRATCSCWTCCDALEHSASSVCVPRISSLLIQLPQHYKRRTRVMKSVIILCQFLSHKFK